jgi:predicted transcriptional regulator
MNDKLMMATSNVLAGFLQKNSFDADQIPALARDVAQALKDACSEGLDMDQAAGQVEKTVAKLPTATAASAQQPAVPIEQSVQDDYIVCLEDGKKLKMLKRHIESVYGLTPKMYREKWGLPEDYPMVAPNYSKVRQRLAKRGPLAQINENQKAAAQARKDSKSKSAQAA